MSARRYLILGIFILVSVVFFVWQYRTQQSAPPRTETRAPHIGPANLYPDPKLTPGKADTYSIADIQATYTENCPHHRPVCTYSESHRDVTESEKKAVYDEYEQLYPGLTAYCREPGFTSGRNQRCEVDHFCPVGIGCSNDIENLWIQRADASATINGVEMQLGFHQKDDLEAWGIEQVKAGRLQPKQFDEKIWTDWVAYYLEVRPPHQHLGW